MCRRVLLYKIHVRKPELCKVLLAIHNLTGVVAMSKVGTKKGGLKAPTELLKEFDKSDDTTKAVEYLVKMLNKSLSSTTFGEYRQDIYHHSKSALAMAELSPTSTGIAAHHVGKIRHEACQQLLSHIYSRPLVLDPLEYGFYLADGEVLILT